MAETFASTELVVARRTEATVALISSPDAVLPE